MPTKTTRAITTFCLNNVNTMIGMLWEDPETVHAMDEVPNTDRFEPALPVLSDKASVEESRR